MADLNSPSDVKLEVGKNVEKITCPLVSLPSIILTRIDSEIITSPTTISSTMKNKDTSENLKNDKKKLSPNSVNKNMPTSKPRGRPKKIEIDLPRSQQKPIKKSDKRVEQTVKKIIKNEVKNIKRPNKNVPRQSFKPIKREQQSNKKPNKKSESPQKMLKTVIKSKSVSNSRSNSVTTKTILKGTMLQKKRKVAISQAKKPKLIKKGTTKQSPVKKNKPKSAIKIKVPSKIQTSTDSSDDEFLYDELIEEFENNMGRGSKIVHSTREKTTSITLKPNTGNKPPTIVKGGIVKMNNLPSDLKTVASPGQQPAKNITNKISPQKRSNLSPTSCPTPSKKPSPWPISMSNSPKMPPSNKKHKNLVSKQNTADTPKNYKAGITDHPNDSSVNLSTAISENGNDNQLDESKSNSAMPAKRKFGPKLTANVGSISNTLDVDDDLSDEYTEEETLEHEYDTFYTPKQESSNYNKNAKKDCLDSSTVKTSVSHIDTVKDDEDPNIDLLRILTDESEEITLNQSENSKVKTESRGVNTITPYEAPVNEKKNGTSQERTIYDLINEVSLQRPSWNLHIIPETNAFCIAQVTKGRLGLPTLKKCIELDPVDFASKVYIHQYHIKRFDGVYDSEDSILALIDEIDSIKA